MEEERYYEGDEIDLREFLRILSKGKRIILGLVIIAVLGAGFFSKFIVKPVYETEASFLAPSFTLLNGRELKRDDYLSFIHGNELGEELIRKYDLQEKTPNFSVENLNKKISINTKKDRDLVNVKLKDSNPELARDMLNDWLSKFQQRLTNYIKTNNSQYLEGLNVARTGYQRDYEKALVDLGSFQEEVNLDLLVAELSNQESRFIQIEERIASLKRDTQKINNDKVLSQLGQTERLITTKEEIRPNNLNKIEVLMSENELVNRSTADNEQMNSLYTKTEEMKLNLEQSLVLNETELDLLITESSELKKEIKKLQTIIPKNRQKETLLKQKVDLAGQNYERASEAYSEARQTLSKNDYQLDLIRQAMAPTNPISPNTKLNVVIAGLLALMIGIFVVYFREYMKNDDEKVSNLQESL